MKKYITDERTELKYELDGGYYLIAGDEEPDEEQPHIGIWRDGGIWSIYAVTKEFPVLEYKSAAN